MLPASIGANPEVPVCESWSMSRRRRELGSIALLAGGLVALLLATVTLYLQERILDGDRFADSVVASLDDPDVNRYVSARITDRVIDRVDPNLVAVNPLVESAVGALLDTEALRAALRRGVLVAHGAVFDRDLDAAAVAVADVGALIRPPLERLDPQVAAQVPQGLDTEIANFADQPLLVDSAQAADTLNRWAGVLPALAILLLAGSVLLAPHRRRAAIRAGLAIVCVAAVSIVAYEVSRGALLSRVDGGDRDAAAALFGELFGALVGWELAVAALGVVLATAAAATTRRFDLHEPLRGVWAYVTREPQGARARATWALALTAAGIAMVLAPGRILDAIVIVAGAYLIARAVGVAVGALAERRGWSAEPAEPVSDPRRLLVTGAVVVGLCALVAGVGLSLALRDDSEPATAAKPSGACNGERALCDRRLDQVGFAATHNSYAGSGYPGFLFPAQEGTISSQLAAGVRGLWIDTYYGVPGRRVFTRTDLIDPALNAQLKEELGPEFERAAAQARDRIADPPADAPRRIYLCHGFCELGAVEAGDAFRTIARFLDRNPEEVLIIDIEDYTRPRDTVALLERSGLADYVYRGPDGPPWPTLREMIDSGQRVLLVVEHRTEGAPSWYRPAYKRIFQETPFTFRAPDQMNCARNRGAASNSLFLINHWIATDPTPRPSNAAIVNAYDFLLDRARRCERRRGLFPNVLSVDFFGEGQLQAVIGSLNDVSQSTSPE